MGTRKYILNEKDHFSDIIIRNDSDYFASEFFEFKDFSNIFNYKLNLCIRKNEYNFLILQVDSKILEVEDNVEYQFHNE